jgi:predicted nuclease with TOPRIM domain
MSDNGIDDDVLERLEAEALVADAQPEELTLAVESEIEQRDSEIEELEEEVDEKESRVEELEDEVDEKESEIEDMQEKVDTIAESYAEELAQRSDLMDSDDFLDKFTLEELQDKVDDLDVAPAPNANSGDPGAGVQGPNNGDGQREPEGEELSEAEELATSAFEERARKTGKDYWSDIAEDIENGGE